MSETAQIAEVNQSVGNYQPPATTVNDLIRGDGVSVEKSEESEQSPVEKVLAGQYDANAVQSVFVDVIDDDEKFQVEHQFNPHSDEHFFQFDEKRETLLKTNETNKKIRLKNKATAAYLWFWNLFCTAVVGYGDPNEPLPENWRDLVPDEDKIKAVDGLFSAQIIPQKKISGRKFAAWNRDQSADYRLDVLFDGRIIETQHLLGAKTAEIVSDWNDLTGGIEFSSNRLLENNQELSIPATAREKVPFYERLVVGEPLGYRGRVPAFIKLLLVNDRLASKSQTAKKHIQSETP